MKMIMIYMIVGILKNKTLPRVKKKLYCSFLIIFSCFISNPKSCFTKTDG